MIILTKTTISSKMVKKQPCLLIILLLATHFFTLKAISQGEALLRIEEDYKLTQPAYLNIAIGLNISNFRDFATSPLIYSGKPLYTALSHIDLDEKRESHFTLSYAIGKFTSNINQHASESKVNSFTIHYLELFQLKKISNSKLNIKIGGQLNATLNHRENKQLFNNSEAVDVITTLFGSIKATLDLTRKEDKNEKFLFFKNKANRRRSTLSCTLNVGVVNSSFRNGFAYTSPSAPLNEDDFFAGYEFQIFKGFRLNSALDYTVFSHNKNAIQFSYIWDAYKTSGHHDNFEMAVHTLKFSLLFSLK
jgi:hypothetical protein